MHQGQKNGWLVFAGAGLAYGLSALGHSVVEVSSAATILAGLVALYLGYRRPQLGILLILAELSIGSFGRLFSVTIPGYPVSLRQALFVGVLLGWLVCKFMKRERVQWFPAPISGPLRLLWLAVAISMLSGLGHSGPAAVFSDANGYWFLLLAPVFFDALKASDWGMVGRWLAGTQGAVATLTVGLLLAFAWLPESIARATYTWVRDVRLGEVTYLSGTYFRIFFQSHFYSLLLGLGALAATVSSGPWSKRWTPVLAAAAGISVVASLSRSLWVGLIFGLVAMLYGLHMYRDWSLLKLAKLGFAVVIVAIIQIVLLQVITGNFPLGELQQRFALAEPAAASRAAQLGPLLRGIQDHPIWGSGFGQELTYQTADPRRLSSSTSVTTSTFELGWLDTWLDIGLVGVLALLWWLVMLWRMGKSLAGQSWAGLATMAASVAAAAVHLFTPYLNHPLGLGALLALSALLPRTHPDHA